MTTPLLQRMRSLVLVTATVGGLWALASAVDHPVAGDLLKLKDGAPGRRRVFFRAARDPRITPGPAADPRTLGATLQVIGLDPGDGNSGAISLPPDRWRGLGRPPGSKGFRYRDRAASNGIDKVVLRRGAGGGMLLISGRGRAWSYVIQKPQGPIEVRFAVGDQVYCASFTRFRRNIAGTVVARDGSTPAACTMGPVDTCGNGTLERAEECDDGSTVPGDGCSAACTRESTRCGDGVAGSDEECDDGNAASGDGCSSTCQLESTDAICAGVPTVVTGTLSTVLFASGLESPTGIAAAPLDPRRVFIVEQPGRIRVVRDGAHLPTPFLTIESKILHSGERGFLGLAFHPGYEQNGFFYVYYTRQGDGAIVVARYRGTADPDLADPASEHIVLTVPHGQFGNHNGGQLAFGADGALYAGTGDGGGGCDPGNNARDDGSRLGKLLRIDVDATPETTQTWAKGLRNPWRFSFDRGTGDLYIGDVGQNAWEEIDYDPAPVEQGVNYGWDGYEGNHCSNNPRSHCSDSCPDPSGLTMPLHEYQFPASSGCTQSVTGGYVYRGCRMPAVRGTYFFAEYCQGLIESLAVVDDEARNVTDLTVELRPPDGSTIDQISTFGEDARGELYLADHDDGKVYAIVPAR